MPKFSLLKKINRSVFLVLLVFSCMAKATLVVYKMPPHLVKQLKEETEQRQRGECEKEREFSINSAYVFNNKVLFFIGLPDYLCNASSFIPVTVDKKGQWQAGTVVESHPSFLHATKAGELWLVSHWEIEGVFPLLHFSTDGINWREISLPKPESLECCFQYLKQLCISASTIDIKMTGIEETPQEYWQTSLKDSLTSISHWQKLATATVKNRQHCQNQGMTSGDWQQQVAENGNEIWLESKEYAMKVIIPRWFK